MLHQPKPRRLQTAPGHSAAAFVLDYVRQHNLKPGDRLPSVRALAQAAHRSPVALNQAVALLRARGLLVTRPNRGTFLVRRADSGMDVEHAAPAAPLSLR